MSGRCRLAPAAATKRPRPARFRPWSAALREADGALHANRIEPPMDCHPLLLKNQKEGAPAGPLHDNQANAQPPHLRSPQLRSCPAGRRPPRKYRGRNAKAIFHPRQKALPLTQPVRRPGLFPDAPDPERLMARFRLLEGCLTKLVGAGTPAPILLSSLCWLGAFPRVPNDGRYVSFVAEAGWPPGK